MKTDDLLGSWIKRFLLEHVLGERGLSLNTQASYRDTLKIFLSWASLDLRKRPDEFELTDISADLIRQFLAHIEKERKCGIATRNQRLAAIHALARFIQYRSPEQVDWSGKILSVPFKRGSRSVLTYLEKAEMDALLSAPDQHTTQGARDHAILLFLYNTGARASEVARLVRANLHLDSSPAWVRILGKGNKERTCPLWPATARTLAPFAAKRESSEFVFFNQRGAPLTRYGIRDVVKSAAAKAGAHVRSLREKRIGPHSVRHTTAVHLLRAGVDINTIREWLGHASLDTTNVYAETDLEMKAKALALCEVKKPRRNRVSRRDHSVMTFLRTLQKADGPDSELCGVNSPELVR